MTFSWIPHNRVILAIVAQALTVFAVPSLAADKAVTAAACAKNLAPLIDPAKLAIGPREVRGESVTRAHNSLQPASPPRTLFHRNE